MAECEGCSFDVDGVVSAVGIVGGRIYVEALCGDCRKMLGYEVVEMVQPCLPGIRMEEFDKWILWWNMQYRLMELYY